MIDKVIRFCLENKLVVMLIVIVIVAWGAMVAPFDWELGGLPRSPVPTDAIPDIGENQQIVFTEWMGRSPQDVEDQITYPLTVSLLGVPGVKTIRSYSFFGFSTIYVIFKEDVEFYWSRTRVLEKLNSLPAGTLPESVTPTLGPDSTPLGQIYWYTLEGRDPDGNPAGGWDLDQLRTIQDWYVRYYLLAAEGISEVASVGGFVQEYQIDVDPDAMRAARVSIDDIFMAVKMSNIDVGARSIEINKAEYFIRGLGFIEEVEDIEYSVVASNDNVPIYVKDVAKVTLGPALRRGALDKGGAEAVGGVVVVRYGFNPLESIKNVKEKIDEFDDGLPTKAVVDYRKVTRDEVIAYADSQGIDAFTGVELNHDAWVKYLRATPRDEWPEWVTTSQVTVVPFYDRTGLIYETLGTLHTALVEEILVTIIVILVMVMHLRSSILISALLPLAVLMCFIAMRVFHVDANIVALSGIAIAIGTMVDMGIILCENILKHLDEAAPDENKLEVIHRASTEVGGAVLTAVSTTIISFLPVFTMIGAEGKLFKPLAFTKTFALAASVIVALTIIPPTAHLLFTTQVKTRVLKQILYAGLISGGIIIAVWLAWWAGLILAALGSYKLVEESLPAGWKGWKTRLHWGGMLLANGAAVVLVGILLTEDWLPLGPQKGLLRNLVFVAVCIGGLLGFFQVFQRYLYKPILRWSLDHKLLFLCAPGLVLLLGFSAWLGPQVVFGRIPKEYDAQSLSQEQVAELSAIERFKYDLGGLRGKTWEDLAHRSLGTKLEWTLATSWEGFGKEFMPPLDEGSYLYMPTTMPHASIGEATDVLSLQGRRINNVPEVELAVGKIGRVRSPLDPAPISMIETVINYGTEYIVDKDGHRLNFRFHPAEVDWSQDKEGKLLPADDGQPYRVQGKFERDEAGQLIPDPDGVPFRQWRQPLDPQLNPGREAWKGIVKPDDIWHEIVEAAQVPGTTSAPRLQPIAARIVMLQSGMRAPMGVKVKGPDLDTIEKVALEIETLLKQVASVEASAVIADRVVGKPYLEIDFKRRQIARYGMTIRQVQDVVEVAIGGKTITTTVEGRERFPVRVRYLRELRNEIETIEKILIPAKDGSHIPLAQVADITYVRGPQVIKSEDTFLTAYVLFDMKPGAAEVNVVEDCQRYLQDKIDSGQFSLPPGVSYTFAGNYENQIRSQKTLIVVLPLALFIIFMILYFQFKDPITTSLVFSGIAIAWSGGFIMLWLYGQPWFMNFDVFGTNMQDLFQIHPINLSVAIWVGFLALFGIASDDGVVITTYLDQSFRVKQIDTIEDARRATLEGGLRRVRPCLMTTATTILALIPVLTSTGRGADIMVPMAIPSFGGMTIEIMTMLVVPVLYCWVKEWKIRLGVKDRLFAKQG
ncbi:efflux RND transporter permease subunit [Symmachiella dynata]|mgnify:CR=1 FL=1|uniref:efflux RND transporter permease subunit n=1 Tax=Symmachiella dynata TaxID=2527995 RepID=UPI0030ED4EAA